MIRKLKQISLLLLSLGVAMSAGAQIQGFESSGSTWKFTPKPAAYNDINNTDIWDDTTGVGYNGSGLSQITAKSGTYCWVARDIDNPIAIGWHYLDFDTINISSFNSNLLEFYYYSVGFDATDSIAYIVQYDNSATWNFGDKVMLNKNTGQWTQVQVNIPSGKTYVRLRLMVKQNGNDDWAAFDDVSLSSSNTDNIKPTVINSWIENANTVKIAYSEAMNSFVDSSKYYSGLTNISSVVSKMSGGLDTATITLSSGLLPGKFMSCK